MNKDINRKSSSVIKSWLSILTLLTLLSVSLGKANADSFAERRALVGLKLFRTLITADLKLAEKANQDNALPVLLIYANNKTQADEYRERLESIFEPVKKYSFKIEVANVFEFEKVRNDKKVGDDKYAAVFIAQQLNNDELIPVIEYGIKNSVVVFSPFEGDVEKGVLAGISVQATVRPMLNMDTLNQSKLLIKPFYLKVAKQYE